LKNLLSKSKSKEFKNVMQIIYLKTASWKFVVFNIYFVETLAFDIYNAKKHTYFPQPIRSFMLG